VIADGGDNDCHFRRVARTAGSPARRHARHWIQRERDT
jgi:hypothetical protein